MIEAGRVTVTFTSLKTGEHITLVAKCRAPHADTGKWEHASLEDAKVMFIEVPNSGGWNDKVGRVTRSKGFVADPSADNARVFCAKQLLKFLAGEETHADMTVQEADQCGKCGRELTDPESIARGIGPTCLGAETGSKHQEKAKVDKKGVNLAVGDWRARKAFLDAELKEERTSEPVPVSSQQRVLEGTTWEDIFGGEAAIEMEAEGLVIRQEENRARRLASQGR